MDEPTEVFIFSPGMEVFTTLGAAQDHMNTAYEHQTFMSGWKQQTINLWTADVEYKSEKGHPMRSACRIFRRVVHT